MSADAFVVVVSYNNSHLTRDCIESLLAQYSVNLRIVVWDNASPDGSGDKLAEWYGEHPAVVVYRSSENLLWTPAINMAIEMFSTEEPIIGFMNNDITLPPHAIKSMSTLLRDESIGLVGPHGPGFGGPQDFATYHGEVDDAHSYCATLSPKRVPYLVGACCFLRTDTWQKIGPLDPSMPLGADDHDYCIRLKKEGLQIWVDQRVYASHTSHATGGETEIWNSSGAESWKRFEEKWGGYYSSEEEALKSHWGGVYVEGFDR